MKEPTYKPESWIIYQQGTFGGYGRIIGAAFDGENWNYTTQGSLVNGELHAVKEDEITFLFQNGSWLAPTHLDSRGGSAYTDTNAEEA